jgi:hypothetical protein
MYEGKVSPTNVSELRTKEEERQKGRGGGAGGSKTEEASSTSEPVVQKKKKKKFGLKLTLDHSDAIATPRPIVEGKTSDASSSSSSSSASPTKTKFKKKNRLGLTLVVEDSNHEPESPKNSPPKEGGGFGLSVDTSGNNDNENRREGVQMYDDGHGGNSYGMSDSGTFAIEGFLIRQNGIAEAPGQQHSSPGFGRGGGSKSSEEEGKMSEDGEGISTSSSYRGGEAGEEAFGEVM